MKKAIATSLISCLVACTPVNKEITVVEEETHFLERKRPFETREAVEKTIKTYYVTDRGPFGFGRTIDSVGIRKEQYERFYGFNGKMPYIREVKK